MGAEAANSPERFLSTPTWLSMYLRQLFKYWTLQVFVPGKLLRLKYEAFKELLRHDKNCLELITDLEEILYSGMAVDWARVQSLVRALRWSTASLIRSLVTMQPAVYGDLEKQFHTIESSLGEAMDGSPGDSSPSYTLSLREAAEDMGAAGGKAHHLGRVVRDADLPVPAGFVITTNAFCRFIDHNNLRHRLDELLAQVRLDDDIRLNELAQELTAMVATGEVPPLVCQEIEQRFDQLQQEGWNGPWSLRSSALSEDGERSFAGQYASIMPVSREDVVTAYKRVLASKYTAKALAYRIRWGVADAEVPMAVLVMTMVDARLSGVMYTAEAGPEGEEAACLGIYAIPGMGHRLVSGRATPQVQYFTKKPQLARLPATQASPGPSRGGETPCLTPDTAARLAQWGMDLEQLLGGPQDIEWCQDRQGALFILQARPLVMGVPALPWSQEAQQLQLVDIPIILEGGSSASAGVGSGRVFLIKGEDDMREVPEGSVLVAATLPPSLVRIIGRLRAVVAEGGSRASHFASVAREFGLPVLVNAIEATNRLAAGQLVTVDAGRGRIYEGDATGQIPVAPRPGRDSDAAFSVRLQRVMDHIAPLHLTDPAASDFQPRTCSSIHDIVRFAHEKGMAEMFSLVGRSGRGMARARQLETDLPLILYVLDLDGGIAPEADNRRKVAPQFIRSRPMQACWRGLTHPEVVWQKGLVLVDWEAVDRHSGGIISLRSANLASYAVLAQEYLHFIIRFGYHFAVLDTLCSDDAEANYIAFRFKGGGGNYDNRLLRIQAIEQVLQWAGFTVKTRGDLLDARLERQPAAAILARLTILGILQGKTQLLDMALHDEQQVRELVEDFKAKFGMYLTAAEGKP